MTAEITHGIHACMGCPLYVQEKLSGVLTADAIDPEAFLNIEPKFLKALAALAAAEMHTTDLIEALEQSAKRQGMIAQDLMQDARRRQGQQIVGNSLLMENLRREIDVVAWSDFPVLVTGETGTGKELVVHAIHATSKRRAEPLAVHQLRCLARIAGGQRAIRSCERLVYRGHHQSTRQIRGKPTVGHSFWTKSENYH